MPRGPHRFSFTFDDIARVSGRSVRDVQRAALSKRKGRRALERVEYDPRDLGSTFEWLLKQQDRGR